MADRGESHVTRGWTAQRVTDDSQLRCHEFMHALSMGDSMFQLILRPSVLALVVTFLPLSDALAHCIVGGRFFLRQ